MIALDTDAERARDAAFLMLAEDDALTLLGFGYGGIRAETPESHHSADGSADELVVHWSGVVRCSEESVTQRVQLSAHGPAVEASADALRTVLERAGRVLTRQAPPRDPVTVVLPSSPRIHRGVGGHLVTVGFDVTSRRTTDADVPDTTAEGLDAGRTAGIDADGATA